MNHWQKKDLEKEIQDKFGGKIQVNNMPDYLCYIANHDGHHIDTRPMMRKVNTYLKSKGFKTRMGGGTFAIIKIKDLTL